MSSAAPDSDRTADPVLAAPDLHSSDPGDSLEQLSAPSSWTSDLAWTSLCQFATRWRRVELSASNVGAQSGVHVPPAIVELFDDPIVATRFIESVTPDSVPSLATAWRRCRETGATHCNAFFNDDLETLRTIYFVDLVEQFDLILMMVLPEDETIAEVAQSASSAFAVRERVMVQIVDETSRLVSVDALTTQVLGWGDEVLGKSTLSLMHPDDHERSINMWVEMLSDPGGARQCRLRYRHRDGRYIWVETTNHNLLAEDGTIRRETVDISDEMHAIGEARTNQLVLQGLADSLPSGIIQFDADLEPVFRNRHWDEILGSPILPSVAEISNMLGFPDGLLFHQESLREGETFDGAVTVEPADGSNHRRCQLHMRPLIDDDGTFEGVVCCLHNITESWELQKRLATEASRDSLTGLANRLSLVETIEAALAHARQTDGVTGVLFFDLNGFKRINDQFGHRIGDRLLTDVSDRFREALRPNDVVGRQGGDEFLVVCHDIGDIDGAIGVARRLLLAASGSRIIDGQKLDVRASCGITIDRGGLATPEQLIAEADLAMYEHKRSRSAQPVVFRDEMFEEQRLEIRRDTALERAVRDGGLRVDYQPLVHIGSGDLIGFEALMRWQFDGGIVPPDQFIPVAERRGLIDKIGLWILDHVIRDMADVPRPSLWSVNVSPHQLRDVGFADRVEAMLDSYGVEPSRLALEITEGVSVEDSSAGIENLERLDALGTRLVIDDFGTGFASLDYLRAFPVGALKVDRSFTGDLDQPRTRAIVDNLISLADALDLPLVVEGIETEAQRAALLEMGATLGQGFLFGRPAPLANQPLLG